VYAWTYHEPNLEQVKAAYQLEQRQLDVRIIMTTTFRPVPTWHGDSLHSPRTLLARVKACRGQHSLTPVLHLSRTDSSFYVYFILF
jgi:hypothetical protein